MDNQNAKPSLTLRGYVSHTIRGRKGAQCSEEEMQSNCLKATHDMTAVCNMLSRAGLPVQLYIPGANDLFVQKAYKAGRLTETQILDTDCDIISDCDFLLVYDWGNYIGGGVKTEMEYATTHNIPTIVIHELDQQNYILLLGWLSSLWYELSNKPQIIQFPKDGSAT